MAENKAQRLGELHVAFNPHSTDQLVHAVLNEQAWNFGKGQAQNHFGRSVCLRFCGEQAVFCNGSVQTNRGRVNTECETRERLEALQCPRRARQNMVERAHEALLGKLHGYSAHLLDTGHAPAVCSCSILNEMPNLVELSR